MDATSGPLGDTGNGRGVAWGDYDNDGDLDLYLANSGQANQLFRNEGGGTFVDATSGPLGDTGNGRSVAWGDYDNDGDLDLYLANVRPGEQAVPQRRWRHVRGRYERPAGRYREWGWCGVGGLRQRRGPRPLPRQLGGANKLFRNDGGGTFADATSGPLGDAGSGRGVAWGDYDNDGDLDLYLANNGANKLFRNDGGGTFAAMGGTLGDAGNGTGVAWGDYDNDGDLDLYLANFGGANKLFRNEAAAGQHWLQVKLQGTKSNRSGIGARVRVVAGGVNRIREISGGSGYHQDAMVASFGLGSATSIELLEVRWPSGIVQAVDPAPAVDGALTVLEHQVTAVDEAAPVTFALHHAAPNPSVGRTTIGFALPHSSGVRLELFDVNGRLVRTLVGRVFPAGIHRVVWDGRDGSGRSVASGVYLYRLKAEGFEATQRVLLVR